MEDQLARLKRGQERRVLAEGEGATRAQESAQAETERQRQKLEAQLAEGTAVRLAAAWHVEAAMAELDSALAEYLRAGSSLYSTAARLGRARPRIAGTEALAGYLGWRLNGFLPHDFARPEAHAQRKGLVETLGGEPASAAEPRLGVRYIAAMAPSGGGADAFTLAIVHVEGYGAARRVVQDVMKGWGRKGSQAPDLGSVVREIADVLTLYGLRTVTGDRYAGAWVRQAFAECRINYAEALLDKSAAYLGVEPLFAQGTASLLDHPRLVRELKTLEKRPRGGGPSSITPAGAATTTISATRWRWPPRSRCRQAAPAP